MKRYSITHKNCKIRQKWQNRLRVLLRIISSVYAHSSITPIVYHNNILYRTTYNALNVVPNYKWQKWKSKQEKRAADVFYYAEIGLKTISKR